VRGQAARAIVALRWVLVPLWIVGAVLAYHYLPSIRQTQSAEVGALPLPKDAPALRAEALSKTNFPFPLITRYVVVLRDEDGLAPGTLTQAARTARAAQQGRLEGLDGLAAVAPVPNVVLEPGARPTTILYYLYFRPGVNRVEALDLARRFAQRHVAPQAGEQAYVGVTGSEPAAEVRSNIIPDRLPWVTGATALLVALAVGLRFRSLVAPFVNLATVGIAYLVASRALGWLGQTLGLAVPREVEPVAVVLLFGVVTDYSIFFLSHFRDGLREGFEGRDAAERATGDVVGIVSAAGLVVVLATSSLVTAKLAVFQVFGPALAVAVLIGALVTVTFVPGALAIGGRFVLWPQARPGGREPGGAHESEDDDRSLRARVARLAVRRPLAIAIACVLLLGVAATGLLRYELANPLIQGLPADAEPQRAYAAATAGFPADGVVSPTVAVVREPGLAGQQERLRELGRLLEAQPGVAAVFGPGDLPDGLEGLGENAFVAEGGNLARFLVITEEDPLDERAVDAVTRLEDRAPALLDRAGLADAELLLGGDTAIAAALVERTFRDLGRVAPVALLATYFALALFLRSLVAPVYLVATSVLALLAALGLSAYLHQVLFDPNALTFFVPFAVAVLLLALGSDYNVFLTGRVWDEARGRPLREAVEVASTRAARPIATAGLILAGSFALLAIVPLATFRAAALTMALGLLLDAFLVRQLLVPALIVLAGRRSGWPGRRLGQRPEDHKETRQADEDRR
jgi:RND superfamily putative drug exporter